MQDQPYWKRGVDAGAVLMLAFFPAFFSDNSLIIGGGALAGVLVFLAAVTGGAADRILPGRNRGNGGLHIAFPNECNDDNKQTSVKRSYVLLPAGRKPGGIYAFHQFYIGVINSSPDKTVKNVRIKVIRMNKPDHIIDEYLLVDGTNNTSIDLNGEETAYFHFADGWDHSGAAFFSPRIVPPEEFDRTVAKLKKDDYTRMRIITQKQEIPLLLNDGYRFEVALYGEDQSSTEAVFEANAKDRLEVFYRGAPKQGRIGALWQTTRTRLSRNWRQANVSG